MLSNLTDMTPVQTHSIPLLLANSTTAGDFDNVGLYDLMAAAQTGSGKTLAYLIPILHRIMCTYPSDSMNALVSFSSHNFDNLVSMVISFAFRFR